mgnify:CR=1 FL=1
MNENKTKEINEKPVIYRIKTSNRLSSNSELKSKKHTAPKMPSQNKKINKIKWKRIVKDKKDK